MTENEIVYDILETVRQHQVSDDIDIDRRNVMFHVNNQRALWIRNEYDKPGTQIDHNLIQDLGCLELTTVDAAECCDESIIVGCSVLRTVKQIPNTIEFRSLTGITRVGPIHKQKLPFSFMPYNRVQFSTDEKYGKSIIQAFLLNNYIYLITPDVATSMIDYINVQGIFEDPREAEGFCDAEGNSCYSADDKFPLNRWMYAYFKQNILQELIQSLNVPKDQAGDSAEILGK